MRLRTIGLLSASIIGFFLILVFPITPSFALNNSYTKALLLLQSKPEKKKDALGLLERAFSESQDSEERKNAASLILDIAPEDYSQKEAYLKFLVENFPKAPEILEWKKSYADLLFSKAQFAEAKGLYLQIENQYSNPSLIKYKLAWTYWNQKEYKKSAQSFFELTRAETGALAEQSAKDLVNLLKDAPQLWPMTTKACSESQLSNPLFFHSLLSSSQRSPRVMEMILANIKLLQQVKEFKSQLLKFLLKRDEFKGSGCYFFHNGILRAEDEFPDSMIHECLEDSKNRNSSQLLELMDKRRRNIAHPQISEWQIQYLALENKWFDATQLLFEKSDWKPEDIKNLRIFLSKLPDERLAQVEVQHRTKLLKIAEESKDFDLINLFQKYNFEIWFRLEDQLKSKGEPDADFILKKLASLASKEPVGRKRSEIKDLIEQLSSLPINQRMKNAISAAQDLQDFDPKATDEDVYFDEKLSSSLTRETQYIDHALEKIAKTDVRLAFSLNLVSRQAVEDRVASLMTLIKTSKTPTELIEFDQMIQEKKKKIIGKLIKKYRMNEEASKG